MKLAVIPARGGSKRIPGKNIKHFFGRPIIEWSIEAARECDCFDRIMVSTDSEEIADVARNCGADVPFMRPPELSDDHTGTVPVIAHAIRWQLQQGETLEEVCCIYATAPFILASDLRQGFEVLKDTGCDYAFPVTNYPFPIQRAVRIKEDNRLEMITPALFNTRSQDLEEVFHDAGQFYWGTAEAWLGENPVFTSDSAPIVLPRHRVQDIDTPDDWARAEVMFSTINRARAYDG